MGIMIDMTMLCSYGALEKIKSCLAFIIANHAIAILQIIALWLIQDLLLKQPDNKKIHPKIKANPPKGVIAPIQL